MVKELDMVVLTHNFEEYGLEHGDVGTVVHCYSDGVGFEVEFLTASGETIAVLTLTRADIRSRAQREIFRVREFVPVPT